MYITLDAIDFEIFYNFFFVSIDNKKKRKKLVGKSVRSISPTDRFLSKYQISPQGDKKKTDEI